MSVRVLPVDADDSDIVSLVVEWSELLAEGRFADALAMFPHVNEHAWTPELLHETIAGYGVPEPYPDGRMYAITPLLARSDARDIIDRIVMDRENLYGLDPALYLGMIHYDDVPLNGERSDLTARFRIKRVGPDGLTLEFLDIHVM